MSRVKNGPAHHHRRQKILKLAKGFRGRRKNAYRIAKIAVMHALADSFKDRRRKKRDMRGLWIQRINAAIRPFDWSYSTFISALGKAGIIINRKILANIAAREPAVMKKIVEAVGQAG
jgi:large subunit ribosomal protein L20